MSKTSGVHYQKIEKEVRKYGFLTRGGFTPAPEDGVPSLSNGDQPQTVVMVGNTGSDNFWQRFIQSPEYNACGPDPIDHRIERPMDHPMDHPMDQWTRRVIGTLARKFGGEALFPSDGPPYQPFQRWSSRAENLFPSPIGLYISPEWGTWHALRAAILLPVALDDLPALSQQENPCLTCVDQPCLSSCPVDAFVEGQAYDYLACAKHVTSTEGRDCASSGCLARRACPVGQDFTLIPEHAAFHMKAFINARRKSGEVL